MPPAAPHTSNPSAAIAEPVEEPSTTPGWRRRVLIVEDDPELFAVFERFTARVDPGLAIDFAENPDEAIERLASDVRYDAVVTDYCLPRPKDGKRVARSVSTLRPKTRLGIVSALMNYKRNDTPFLAKPFTLPEYRSFLQELLADRR